MSSLTVFGSTPSGGSGVDQTARDAAAAEAARAQAAEAALVVPDASPTAKGKVQLAGDLAGSAASPTVPGLAAKQAALNITAVKTGDYTLAANDLAIFDATAATRVATLPTAPADGTRCGVFASAIGTGFLVTIAAGGSDLFNKTGGPSTLKLDFAYQAKVLQYKASTGVWYDAGGNMPVSGLDGRYLSTGGTLASRPAASAVAAGFIYFASDDNGGTAYRSDGASTWTKVAASVTQSGGAELGYAEVTANFTQGASINTFYDVTGLTTTVTVGARPILIEVLIPFLSHSVAASECTCTIVEDGTIVQAVTSMASSANKGDTAVARVRRAPSAGSHTYKAQIKTTAAGTLIAQAGAAFPAFVRVTEG